MSLLRSLGRSYGAYVALFTGLGRSYGVFANIFQRHLARNLLRLLLYLMIPFPQKYETPRIMRHIFVYIRKSFPRLKLRNRHRVSMLKPKHRLT